MSDSLWCWRCRSCARLSLVAQKILSQNEEDAVPEYLYPVGDQETPSVSCVCCGEEDMLELIEVSPITVDDLISHQIGISPVAICREDGELSLIIEGEGEYSAREEYAHIMIALIEGGEMIECFSGDNPIWETWTYPYDEDVYLVISVGGFHIWRIPMISYSL